MRAVQLKSDSGRSIIELDLGFLSVGRSRDRCVREGRRRCRNGKNTSHTGTDTGDVWLDSIGRDASFKTHQVPSQKWSL